MTSDALTPLRVGFDMSAAVVGRPGVQRYTADVADEWVPIVPGTDAALLLAELRDQLQP